jgi:hypothetical protein
MAREVGAGFVGPPSEAVQFGVGGSVAGATLAVPLAVPLAALLGPLWLAPLAVPFAASLGTLSLAPLSSSLAATLHTALVPLAALVGRERAGNSVSKLPTERREGVVDAGRWARALASGWATFQRLVGLPSGSGSDSGSKLSLVFLRFGARWPSLGAGRRRRNSGEVTTAMLGMWGE